MIVTMENQLPVTCRNYLMHMSCGTQSNRAPTHYRCSIQSRLSLAVPNLLCINIKKHKTAQTENCSDCLVQSPKLDPCGLLGLEKIYGRGRVFGKLISLRIAHGVGESCCKGVYKVQCKGWRIYSSLDGQMAS